MVFIYSLFYTIDTLPIDKLLNSKDCARDNESIRSFSQESYIFFCRRMEKTYENLVKRSVPLENGAKWYAIAYSTTLIVVQQRWYHKYNRFVPSR